MKEFLARFFDALKKILPLLYLIAFCVGSNMILHATDVIIPHPFDTRLVGTLLCVFSGIYFGLSLYTPWGKK